MSQTIPTFSSLIELQGKLAEILQSGPLYRRLNYTEEACHYVDNTRSAPLFGLLPRELHMFCPQNNARRNSVGRANLQKSIFRMKLRSENTRVTTAKESLFTSITSSGQEKKERGVSRKSANTRH